ncbi:MAG TPA: hypothetical protein VIK91_11570 [Nannocystis sp.]
MQPTTTGALEIAIIAALHAITPSHEHERARTWRHTPSEHQRGRAVLAGTDLRSFDLVWSNARPSFMWQGSGPQAWAAELRICVSYRNLPPELARHVIALDGRDLYRALWALPEPTTPGLSHFEFLGTEIGDTADPAMLTADFLLRAHWAQD